ncbi:MAG: glycosyltransferase [Bacteroidaceae bacterium]|nr:glycosyltransferase [Bacteroidaceae bacterium]
MRVLIVSTSERSGGAAIAANRLCRALINNGVQAKMLVRDKQTDAMTTVRVRQTKWDKAWERLRIFIANGFSFDGLWAVDIASCGTDITRLPEFREADVIHLHWVNQGFLSLKSIRKILRSGKRVVWTLHDHWPVTAVCHHSVDCSEFERGCQNCWRLKGRLPHAVFKKKQVIYGDTTADCLTFVGCSQWTAALARRSPLTAGHSVTAIPNPVPHDIFYPHERDEARREFGLPLGQHLVLFAACNVADKMKGIDLLIQASFCFRPEEDVAFVVVGNNSRPEFQMPIYSIPYVTDEHQMARLYSAVDVFVTPSLLENLPNTIAEAMSCGTPCVGFPVGGIPEMIEHMKNGYVAKLRDVEDLADGIRYCLEHDMRTEAASHAARLFGESHVVRRYMEVYGELDDEKANL